MARPRPKTHPASPQRKRCVIYTRISRDDSDKLRANARQEEKCRAKALYKEYDVVEVIHDKVSAFSGKDREGWQRVLEMVRNGEVDVILAYHMDRITRSMKDLEALIDLCLETGVGIDTATGDIELTSDMGRMIARILAAVARAEVERKSQRQRDAYEQRANEGLPHAVKCFGYTNDGLHTVPVEADALIAAAADVLESYTITEIKERWVKAFPDHGCLVRDDDHSGEATLCVKVDEPHDNCEEFVPSRAPRTNNGVRLALLNPRYAGIRMYLGENMGTGQWPAILDIDTHLALRNMLEDPTRMKGTIRAQGRKPTTLLAGIAVCKVCGQATKSTRAHGVLIYGCHGGNHVNTPRVEADEWVLATLCKRLAAPEFLETLVPSDDGEYDTARDRRKELREAKDALAVAFTKGQIDASQLAAGSASLAEQMLEAERILARAPIAAPMRGLKVGTDAVVRQIMDLPLERKRALIESWLHVTLVPRGKGNHRKPEISIEEQVLIDGAA